MREEQYPESPFLTIPEAAKILRFNNLTLWKMVTRGEIKGFKVGSKWRIRKDFIDKMEWTTT